MTYKQIRDQLITQNHISSDLKAIINRDIYKQIDHRSNHEIIARSKNKVSYISMGVCYDC